MRLMTASYVATAVLQALIQFDWGFMAWVTLFVAAVGGYLLIEFVWEHAAKSSAPKPDGRRIGPRGGRETR